MKKVINRIIEMLINNKELGACGMSEDLIGWLELGDIPYENLTEADFEYMYENNNLTRKEVKLVYEINPYVEQLTNKLVEMWESEEQENE